jgi:RNA exonuclease 4
VSGVSSVSKRVHGLVKGLSLDKPGRRSVVAIDCEMVGGGLDGTLDLCARICIIDEDENVLLNTHVKPEIPVTDYRYCYIMKL